MTSHPRRGSGPVRQHSLQQPPRRHHQMRRQRSAEEDRALQIRTTDPIRARRDAERPNVERPKVRIAWSDDTRTMTTGQADDDEDADEDDARVEVVARQIAASKTRATQKQSRLAGRNSAQDKTCSTLLYSRQELAERLRLAWKQREANKSNIDVFLAHGTTDDRCESRLSSCSSVERSPGRSSSPARGGNSEKDANPSEKMDKIACGNLAKSAITSGDVGCTPEVDATTRAFQAARSKRASFRSATNAAFLELANDPAVGSTPCEPPAVATKRESPQANRDSPQAKAPDVTLMEQKARRTSSAPPQRRANSVGASSRTQVSIFIEAPGIGGADQDSPVSSACPEANSLQARGQGPVGRPAKSAPAKRRARSAKRRANSVALKDQEARAKVVEAKSSEVVTMVSLVSDADSDSDVGANSPRDDKLISQLRSNLPTTPIIKSTVVASTANSVPRRPVKSVSFQQDSIDVEEPDRRSARIRPQSVQVGRVTGSALPTPEEARSWRTELTSLTASTGGSVVTRHQLYECQEIGETSLTDREKRCLVVPIGDPRSDKKRKLLRTRSTPPPRVIGVEKQPTMMQQNETREASSRPRPSTALENGLHVQQSTSILLQASVTKLVEETVVHPKPEDEAEGDVESVEPAFQTTKEKECWHLYRRMCDKGVCVSFDTVLRGMLTPTEYRMRRKEMA